MLEFLRKIFSVAPEAKTELEEAKSRVSNVIKAEAPKIKEAAQKIEAALDVEVAAIAEKVKSKRKTKS